MVKKAQGRQGCRFYAFGTGDLAGRNLTSKVANFCEGRIYEVPYCCPPLLPLDSTCFHRHNRGAVCLPSDHRDDSRWTASAIIGPPESPGTSRSRQLDESEEIVKKAARETKKQFGSGSPELARAYGELARLHLVPHRVIHRTAKGGFPARRRRPDALRQATSP